MISVIFCMFEKNDEDDFLSVEVKEIVESNCWSSLRWVYFLYHVVEKKGCTDKHGLKQFMDSMKIDFKEIWNM